MTIVPTLPIWCSRYSLNPNQKHRAIVEYTAK
jgi:hypothetical protein